MLIAFNENSFNLSIWSSYKQLRVGAFTSSLYICTLTFQLYKKKIVQLLSHYHHNLFRFFFLSFFLLSTAESFFSPACFFDEAPRLLVPVVELHSSEERVSLLDLAGIA